MMDPDMAAPEEAFSGATVDAAASAGSDGGLVGNLGDAGSALWNGAGHAIDAVGHLGAAAVTHVEATAAAGVGAGMEVLSAGAMAAGASGASDALHGAAENARQEAKGYDAWTDRFLDRAAGDVMGSDEPAPADPPAPEPAPIQLEPLDQ